MLSDANSPQQANSSVRRDAMTVSSAISVNVFFGTLIALAPAGSDSEERRRRGPQPQGKNILTHSPGGDSYSNKRVDGRKELHLF